MSTAILNNIQCSLIILRFYAFPRKYISANSFSYKCTLWSIFGPCLCIKSCKPTFTPICREFENLSDLRALSRKLLRQKSCYPESFRFFWLYWWQHIGLVLVGQVLWFVTCKVSRKLAVCPPWQLLPMYTTNRNIVESFIRRVFHTWFCIGFLLELM